ncbi:hypothetical protein CVT24_003903 [Panaeolus cyanescens]|uniref:Nephrocystin 3-like N-terminal domain-containing protein n=1 Tax=Panaeolus cyanescens TaxID=181874 RepID=A0A409VVB4_9AGAR|nr:hypothetical protein CVT24_003903 [Panaeolus cyanescens]
MCLTSGITRHNLLVTQSTFTVNQQQDHSGMDLNHQPDLKAHAFSAFYLLNSSVCANAFHNSDLFDDVKCHPGTRAALLKALGDWVSTHSQISQSIIWLHGPAGAGKTAIARSLAEKCTSSSQLAATFFFWKTDSGRCDEKRLIPTLAYQLALSIPPLKPFIEEQIQQDPSTFDRSLAHQMMSLILQPLSRMRKSHPNLEISTFPRLIIIDGLDECGSLRSPEEQIVCQTRVIGLLQELAGKQDIFPFKILVLSRTEFHLRQSFEEAPMHQLVHRIHLDYSFVPEKDILVYVTHEFMEIAQRHPHRRGLPPGWPGTPIIHRIVNLSSGQFIYAATIMKFLRAPRRLPNQQLQILETHLSNNAAAAHQPNPTHTSPSPLAPLDELYHEILLSAVDPLTALKAISFFLVHEMSFLHSDSRNLHLDHVERILGLSPGAILYSLSEFESLLNPAAYFDMEFHHASFVEFLCDKSRSRIWHIDLNAEKEKFCLMDLDAFQSCQPTSINDQEFWFHCFCEALMNSDMNDGIMQALDATWNSMASYSIGLNFFRGMGKKAGSCYAELLQAYGGKKHPDVERQKLCQVLNDSMTKVLNPFIQIYQTRPHLYALFLLCIFDPDFARFSGRAEDKVCRSLRAKLSLAIIQTPEVVALDQRALKIMDHRPQGSNIMWARSMLVSLYKNKYKIKHSNQPPDPMLPDDAALFKAAQLLLDLINCLPSRLVDEQDASSVIRAILRSIFYSLSSQTIGRLVEDREYQPYLLHWIYFSS